MKRKYLKKESIAYKFKHDMLAKDEYANATDKQKEILWEIFLLAMADIKKISKHQANTWKYPETYLK